MTARRWLHSKNNTIGRVFLMRATNRTLSVLWPQAAARLAARLFATPPRPPIPPREEGWADNARRFELETSLGPVAAWSWGDVEPTVLLVHGWAGRGLQLGAFVAPLVERGFRVVAYDALAHGASPGRRSSMPELTVTVCDVARSVGPLAAVIAHSLGATAVLRASARGELAARRLVLLAPSVDMDLAAERFRAVTGFSPRVIARMWRLFEKRFGFTAEELQLEELAKGIRGPSLIVHDAGDPDVPWEEGQALSRAATATRLLTTHGLGHRRLLRSPEVVDAVTHFISEEESELAPPSEGQRALQGGIS